MQFILPLLYSLVFILLIYKIKYFAIESISRSKLAGLFILKLFAGSIVYLVYTNYYSLSDFHTYFSDSKILIEHIFGKASTHQMQSWDAAFENVLFNTSRTMIIMNAILQLFSFGNLFVHIVFFCFFSFVGLTAFYKAFIFHFPIKKTQLIISIFFIPTVLFWSSAALKESLVIALVGLLIYKSNFGLKLKYNLSEVIILCVLFVLLLFVKIYVAIVLLPLLFTNFIIAKATTKKIILYYLLVFGSVFLIAFSVKIIHQDFNVLQLIADKQAKAISEAQGGVFLVNERNFICVDYNKRENILLVQSDSRYRIKNRSEFLSWKLDNMEDTTFVTNSIDTATYHILYSVLPANSVLQMKRLKPHLVNFIMYSPLAISNVLFQPNLFSIKSCLHLVVAIENMWLILLLILAIVFYDKTIIQNKPVFIFCLIFSLLIFVLIGITTPVIGSIIRYRTIGLLFFASIILMMIDEKKIRK